jgi:hypothetical protein
MQINYILKPTGLSSSNTQTYLSKEFPNGLLYACLVEAFGFLKGPMDMIQYYEKRYASQHKASQLNKWVDEEEMNIKMVHLEFDNNNNRSKKWQ